MDIASKEGSSGTSLILSLAALTILAAVIAYAVSDSQPFEEKQGKLNQETENYLKTANSQEEKDYIAKFEHSINQNKLAKTNLKKRYERLNTVKITAKAKDAQKLLAEPDIKYLELDQKIKPLGDIIPYGVNRTNAPLTWNKTKGKDVKIAVLDTGTSPHYDLVIAGGTSTVSSDYTDNYGHGTAVTGIISSLLNKRGLTGVSPEADIYAVKIMEGSTGELSSAIQGVEWAINNHVDIISMSFGMETYSQIFKETLEEAYSTGILLIAAAGNNGQDNILYPAAYSSVISVGATDQNDQLAVFSSYGNNLELVAPGVQINSTSLGNSYTTSSGTSMAAPHVTGVAALIKAYNSSLTNKQIRAALRNSAIDLGQKGKDKHYGYGLVQADVEHLDPSYTDESYFYEVFNITDYRTPGQNYVFWLNGTGTIDEVNFKAGIYLIKKYLKEGVVDETIQVTEDGTLILLDDNYVLYNDDYTYDCSPNCNNDSIAWKNGALNVEIFWENVNGWTKKAECFDWANDGFTDNCYGNQNDIDLCKGNSTVFNNWCSETSPACTTSGSMGQHTLSTSVSQAEDVHPGFCYKKSDGTYSFNGQLPEYYYICNNRQYVCISGTQYEDRCITTTGPDKTMKTLSCNSGYYCDYSLDENNADFGTSGTQQPTPPCTLNATAPLCNGTIEVNAEDNTGSPLSSLKVYLNTTFNGSTNNIGQKTIPLANIACGTTQQVTVKCSNDITVCGTKTAQVDLNNDTDYLSFDCTPCSTTNDLYISNSDVNVSIDTKTVNATVHSTGITSSVNITLYRQKDDGTIDPQNKLLQTISITAGTVQSANFNLTTLQSTDFLHIYIDANNTVRNELETNNYIFRAASKPVKAFINVTIDPHWNIATETIKEYIATFTQSVNSPSQADIIIIIGHPMFSKSEPFSLNDKLISDGSSPMQKTYAGRVKKGSFENPYSGKPEVIAYGNGIEGDIAAVKRMINARNIFLNKDTDSYTSYIDDYDTLGISVYDQMHTPEATTHHNKNDEQLKDNIKKILYDNNFEVAVRPVVTRETTSYGSNTTLRVKNVNSDFSSDYKNATGISNVPVVISRGIHSNLLSWQDFGKELASNGQEVWLIEMVGGPYTDDTSTEGCGSNCPNYTFADLKDYYWPALIAGVQEYSGKNKIDYIGFSLGCSAALESLKSHQNGENNIGYYFDYNTGKYLFSDLSASPVDTFIGIGCPGNFTKLASLIWLLKESESSFDIIQDLKDQGKQHITMANLVVELGKNIDKLTVSPPSYFPYTEPKELLWYLAGLGADSIGPKMSVNIYDEFLGWINDPNKPNLGQNVNLNNTLLIQGKLDQWLNLYPYPHFEQHPLGQGTDAIVANADIAEACSNINSSNKWYASFDNKYHAFIGPALLPTHQDVKDLIITFLITKNVPPGDSYKSNVVNNCNQI